MITENLSTLKIHKLTQAQYDRELATGNIDPNALYLTPDENGDFVYVVDIVNDLTTDVANKPLSAAQGVALKVLIDAITVPTKVSELNNDSGFISGYTETDPTVPAWAKAATKPIYTAEEVGALSNTTVIPMPTTQTVTLTIADWVDNDDGRYAQNVSVPGVTSTTPIVLVDVALTGADLEADAAALAAWCPEDGSGPSSQNVVQGNGTLTFYCTAIPSVAIPINVGVC